MASRPAIGVGLMAGGAVLIMGGISGRLAPMLAALFYPAALVPSQSGQSSLWSLPELAAVPPASGGSNIPKAVNGGPGGELPPGSGPTGELGQPVIDVPSAPSILKELVPAP